MMANSLEARLQYLETREEAHTRDIIRLKTENAELQTKVCELKRENLQTTEKFAEIHSKIKKLDSENADLQTKVCELKQERALAAAKPVEAETKVMKVENKENTNLEAKVWELKQETVLAVAKLEGAETKIQKVENDLRVVFGFRENIDSRLSCVESKLVSTKEGEDRLNSLETVMNTLRQEVMTAPTPKHPDSAKGSGDTDIIMDKLQNQEEMVKTSQLLVEKRIAKVEAEVKTFHQESNRLRQSVADKTKVSDKQVESRLKKTEANLKSSQEKFENRLRKVEQLEGSGGLAQASAHPQQGLVSNMEMLELQKNVKHLLEVKDAISKSVRWVHLTPTHKPRTNQRVKLGRYHGSDLNGGYFNENSCCFDPPIAGRFAIFVDFGQRGDGIISVYSNSSNGLLCNRQVGSTFQENDVCMNTVIARLAKGDRVWLEMEREQGNADLAWCSMTSWLITPSL